MGLKLQGSGPNTGECVSVYVCVCVSESLFLSGPEGRLGVGGKSIQAADLKELQALGRREERRKLEGGGGGNKPERRPRLC